MVERVVGSSLFRPIPSRILLVDDDPALLDALSSTLHFHLGHTSVETCAAAQHALDRVREHAYDMVISDVRMPEMNGVQLLTHIQQIRPRTPTVLISGTGDQTLLAKAYELGALDFIFKPIDRHEFIVSMRRGLHVARLRSLIARQERFMSHCRAHYLHRIDMLREYTEARVFEAGVLNEALLTRQRSVGTKSPALAHRANRSMARLDAHLDRAIRAHRETMAKLTVAEETCRRLADEKLAQLL